MNAYRWECIYSRETKGFVWHDLAGPLTARRFSASFTSTSSLHNHNRRPIATPLDANLWRTTLQTNLQAVKGSSPILKPWDHGHRQSWILLTVKSGCTQGTVVFLVLGEYATVLSMNQFYLKLLSFTKFWYLEASNLLSPLRSWNDVCDNDDKFPSHRLGMNPLALEIRTLWLGFPDHGASNFELAFGSGPYWTIGLCVTPQICMFIDLSSAGMFINFSRAQWMLSLHLLASKTTY